MENILEEEFKVLRVFLKFINEILYALIMNSINFFYKRSDFLVFVFFGKSFGLSGF